MTIKRYQGDFLVGRAHGRKAGPEKLCEVDYDGLGRASHHN